MRTRAEARRQRWAILAFAVAILVLSFLILKSAYYQLVLTQVLLWAVLSLAWNLLSGYSGYFSFGHAVFWGLGAYTVALGMMYLDLTPWISIPFCAIVGSVPMSDSRDMCATTRRFGSSRTISAWQLAQYVANNRRPRSTRRESGALNAFGHCGDCRDAR